MVLQRRERESERVSEEDRAGEKGIHRAGERLRCWEVREGRREHMGGKREKGGKYIRE